MTQLTPQLAKLIPKPGNSPQRAGAAIAYTKTPSGNQQPILGHLIVVAEAMGRGDQAAAAIEQIFTTVSQSYFTNSLPQSNETAQNAKRFELAIKAVNRQLLTTDNPPLSLSAGIIVAVGDHLYASFSGRASAWLFRKQHETSLTSSGDKQEFSSMMSGRIRSGDKIIIATPALLHHVPATELKSIINNYSPDEAVAKLTDLLDEQPSSARAAAVIAMITEPDIAQLQTIKPTIDSVTKPKMPATGVAQETITPTAPTGQGIASQASKTGTTFYNKIAGANQRGGQLPPSINKIFKSKASKPAIIALSLVLVGSISLALQSSYSRANLAKLEQQYNQAYRLTAMVTPNTPPQASVSARKSLQKAATIVRSLSKNSSVGKLDQKLAQNNPKSADPANVKELQLQIATKLDQLELLKRLEAKTVLDLNTKKISRPSFITISKDKLILISQTGGITILSSDNKSVIATHPAPKEVGKVTAITLIPESGEIVLATSEPRVWIFDPDNPKFSSPGLGLGKWPRGKSIATYNGNIYILGEAGITRQLTTYSGYSLPALLVDAKTTPIVKQSLAMAIDGDIYTVGGGQISRYTAGSKTAELKDLPEKLSQISHLAIPVDGLMIGFDQHHQRIGNFKLDAASITLTNQYSIKGHQLTGVIYNPKTRQLLMISDGKLLSASIK